MVNYLKNRTGLTLAWHVAKVADLSTLHSRTARMRTSHWRWHSGASVAPLVTPLDATGAKAVDGGSILEQDLAPPTFHELPNWFMLLAIWPDFMRRSSRRRPLKLPHRPHRRFLNTGGTVTSKKLSPSHSNFTPCKFKKIVPPLAPGNNNNPRKNPLLVN